MFRMANHFSHSCLKYVMSAFSIEQILSEGMVNSLNNNKCISLQYGMSNMTRRFFIDVSIYLNLFAFFSCI